MNISFFIDRLPPTQNELLRMHWTKQTEQKKMWRFLVNANARDADGVLRIAPEPCEIELIFHVRKASDPDNLTARAKLILDALKHNGIISDDNPNVIAKLNCIQNIVTHQRDQIGVLIQIFEAGK